MVQGYALRTDGDCPAPSYEGGPTWGPWKTCCPPNTYCPPNQYDTVCFQSGTQSTLSQCANSTWNLFVSPVDETYFCCEIGRIGFISTLNATYNFFGCATPTDFNSGAMESLSVRVSGTTTPTPSPTSTSTTTTAAAAATSTSTTTTSPPTSGKSSTNTGAIAGGVVGGVCGAAIIAILIWLVLRYRSRAAKDQEASSPETDYAAPSHSGYAQESHVAASGYQSQGRSPFETPPESHVSRSGRSELPPDAHSSAASELPAEPPVTAHELPSR